MVSVFIYSVTVELNRLTIQHILLKKINLLIKLLIKKFISNIILSQKKIIIGMRNLKLVLGLVFFFGTNFCFAEFNWKLLGQTINRDKFYIDLRSIQKSEQIISYNRLRDYVITDSYGESSSIIFIETNCNDQTSRFLKDVYFKGNMAQGEYVVLEKKG